MDNPIDVNAQINQDVKTVEAQMSLNEATDFLLEHGLSNAPVVETDAQGKKLIGFLSESDCMRALADRFYHSRFKTEEVEVQSIMRHHPFCIRPDIDVFTVANLFNQNNYRHLPVVDEKGYLKGIISRRDILKTLRDQDKKHQEQNSAGHHKPNLREIINHRFILGR